MAGQNEAKAGFADLHVHSHYSYRDGMSSVEELVAAAVELGRTAMALTDHGHAGGFVELQEAADKLGLENPIFGVDMPVTWPEDGIFKEAPGGWAGEGCGAEANRQASGGKTGRCHNVVLLARDQTGLQNLFKLLSWAGTNGYDETGGEPRLHEEVLLEHSAGLALLSGGPGGQISRLLAAEQASEALKVAERYREAFGPHFYLE